MKMAKSSTKKLNKQLIPPDIAQELNSVTDYIKHWTLQEINRMQQASKSPICIPIKQGYRIGLYTLKTYNVGCDVNNPNGELIHTFEDKRSAVLYTIYTIKRQYKTADTILALDIEINKNYADIQAWRRHIVQARKKKDYYSADIRQSRLEIAEKCLSHARNEISKIYLTAKHNKIWD
jgi:hypothetical protein